MTGEGDRITIVVHLPQPITTISRILELLAEEFPDARTDTSQPEGWRIELGAR